MGDTVLVELSGYLNTPVKGVSTAFAILFTISGVLHSFQNSKYKSWPLLWLLPFTSLIFTAGFICRECNAYHHQNDSLLAASQGLLFSGVAIITGSLYFILYGLIAIQPHLSPLRPSLICTILLFLICAIISLTSQGTSTFFNPTASRSSIRASLAILKTSLILQLLFSSSLIGILGMFHRRCSVARVFHTNGNREIKTAMLTLYASAALILVCNIFSTVQIFSPSHSPAWKTDAPFWVFDAMPLLVCMLALNVLHPGKLLLA